MFSAERTGSTKRLGDANRGMRLASWVDEGFAETVAATSAGRPGVRLRHAESGGDAARSDDQREHAFCNLDSGGARCRPRHPLRVREPGQPEAWT